MKRIYFLVSLLYVLCISGCAQSSGSKEGSIIITLEPQVDQLLHKWSRYSNDTTVGHALASARKAVRAGSSDDFVSLFGRAYRASAPQAKLSDVFGHTPLFRGAITASSTDDQVSAVLHHAVDSVLQRSIAILQRRMDVMKGKKSSVTVTRNGNSITVEIWGQIPEQTKNRLTTLAQLELWETYENEEIFPILMRVDELIAREQARSGQQDENNGHPLTSILFPAIDAGRLRPGPVIGYAQPRDTARINGYLSRPAVRAILPETLHPLWSALPYGTGGTMHMLYAARADSATLDAAITSDMITGAKAGTDLGMPACNLTMDNKGTQIFAEITGRAAPAPAAARPTERCIAIVMDNRVVIAPRVYSRIEGGKAQITGLGTAEKTQEMAAILSAGALPVRVLIITERVSGGR